MAGHRTSQGRPDCGSQRNQRLTEQNNMHHDTNHTPVTMASTMHVIAEMDLQLIRSGVPFVSYSSQWELCLYQYHSTDTARGTPLHPCSGAKERRNQYCRIFEKRYQPVQRASRHIHEIFHGSVAYHYMLHFVILFISDHTWRFRMADIPWQIYFIWHLPSTTTSISQGSDWSQITVISIKQYINCCWYFTDADERLIKGVPNGKETIVRNAYTVCAFSYKEIKNGIEIIASLTDIFQIFSGYQVMTYRIDWSNGSLYLYRFTIENHMFTKLCLKVPVA